MQADAKEARELAGGAVALIDERGRVFEILRDPEDIEFFWEAWAERDIVYCSICDGIGHGQPGYGPCPLEETGRCDCNGRMAPDGSGCMCGGS